MWSYAAVAPLRQGALLHILVALSIYLGYGCLPISSKHSGYSSLTSVWQRIQKFFETKKDLKQRIFSSRKLLLTLWAILCKP